MNLLNIIQKTKVLNNFQIEDFDDFAGNRGGTGNSSGVSGGTGGGTGGTTSGIIVPSLSITPNTNQTLAIGTTQCFNASGVISLPLEPEATADLDMGCSSYSAGVFTKTCGTQNAYDSERYSSRPIPQFQPFHIVARNQFFNTPGSPTNNSSTIIGVRSTGGYWFYWEVFKYCNATAGNCGSSWFAYAKMNMPPGIVVTIGGGLVEQNQHFKIKSDGNDMIWEYTTFNNWVYNYHRRPIPADVGEFTFTVDGLYSNNTWSDVRTYRGSYQAPVTDFVWTTNAPEGLVISGSQACYTPLAQGNHQVCVAAAGLDPICLNVNAVPLFFRPLDKVCQ
jgi:hypothetical protein